MDASTSAAGLAALNRFDFNNWDEVTAVLTKHGFQLAHQGHATHGPEQLWLITSERAEGVTLIGDTALLYFAMGLAAADEYPAQ
jgi:hypothetical protein